MKIGSRSLAIREIQIKTMMRYHYTPIERFEIKNNDNTKYWQGCEETGSLTDCDEYVKWYSHFRK